MSKVTAMAVIAMVIVAFLVMPVSAANADNGLYTSKYADTPTGYPTTGQISGQLRCANNLLTAGATVTDPNGIVSTLDILPDGTFYLSNLAPGTYVFYLADGNGGQPESTTADVRAGYTSFLNSELLGHAVSPADEPVAADVITVVNASYGMQRVVIDQQAVPGIPAVPAVTHQDYQAGHVHAKKVSGFSSHDFYYNGHKYQIVGNQAEAAFIVHNYYCVHAAQMVTIIDVPAIPAVPAIPELSHVEGSFIDVTAQVQQALDGGNRDFVFNNAMNPGGIVNVAQDTVIVAIQDPAVGQVKNVTINVMVNGILTTINTQEYQTINI